MTDLLLLGAGRGVLVPAIDYVARHGVTAHWTMAGTTTEVDVIAGLTLNPTNAPGSAVGKVGNCRTFNGTNARLTVSDNAATSTGDIAFMVSFWMLLTSKAARAIPFGKGTSSTAEYYFEYSQATDRFIWNIRGPAGGTVRSVTASTFGSPSVDTFYHGAVYHDPTANLLGVAINGGAWDTAGTSGTAPADQAGNFYIGASPAPADFWPGSVDEFVFAKPTDIPTYADEFRDLHYNAGSGRAYPWT